MNLDRERVSETRAIQQIHIDICKEEQIMGEVLLLVQEQLER